MRAAAAAAAHEDGVRALLPLAPTVFVLRGPSGCGKSSLARRVIESLPPDVPAAVASADSYFVGPDGAYRFVPEALRDAHQACRRQFDAALRDRVPVVIVDNTHSARWEYAPFVAATVAFNRAVEQGVIAGVGGGGGGGGSGAGRPATGGGGAGRPAAGGGGWAASGFIGADQWASRYGTERSDAACAPVFAARDAALRRSLAPGAYRLVVVELHVPDAQALQVCVARGAHGVPRETTLRQWEGLRHSPDPAAVRVPALLLPAGGGGGGGGATVVAAGSARVVVGAAAAVPPAAPPMVAQPPQRRGASSWRECVGAGAPTAATAASPRPPAPHSGSGLLLPSRLGSLGGGAAAFLLPAAPPAPPPPSPPRLPADCSVVYVGLFLTPACRAELLARVAPPEFATLHGDHVTVVHAPPAHALSHTLLAALGATVSLQVTAHVTSWRCGAQAVTVAWPRATARARRREHRASPRSSSLSPSSSTASSHSSAGVGAAHDDLDDVGDDDGGGGGGGGDDGDHADDSAAALATVTDRTVEPPDAAADDDDELRVRELLAALVGSCGARAPPARSSMRGLSTNPVPHVTVSVRAGVPPLTSNTMLQQPASFAGRSKGGRPPAGVKLKFARAERPVVRARLGLCVARGSYRWFVTSQGALRRWLSDSYG